MPPEQDVFFESLYQNNFNGLVIYARAQLNDTYEAEEVVQDAFYTVLQQKEKLRHHENPRAYLISVLKFKIREYKRARSRYLKIFLSLNYDFLPEVPAPSNPYPVSISGIMEAARETLTEDEWHIFRRYVLNGYGHLRISKELGISRLGQSEASGTDQEETAGRASGTLKINAFVRPGCPLGRRFSFSALGLV